MWVGDFPPPSSRYVVSKYHVMSILIGVAVGLGVAIVYESQNAAGNSLAQAFGVKNKLGV